MRSRLAAVVVFVMAGVSLYYSVREGLNWGRRTHDDRDFDAFVAEVRAAIPPQARVRVVAPDDPRKNPAALRLNAPLHPRILAAEGPADWILELPAGEFDRSRSSFRRVAP